MWKSSCRVFLALPFRAAWFITLVLAVVSSSPTALAVCTPGGITLVSHIPSSTVWTTAETVDVYGLDICEDIRLGTSSGTVGTLGIPVLGARLVGENGWLAKDIALQPGFNDITVSDVANTPFHTFRVERLMPEDLVNELVIDGETLVLNNEVIGTPPFLVGPGSLIEISIHPGLVLPKYGAYLDGRAVFIDEGGNPGTFSFTIPVDNLSPGPADLTLILDVDDGQHLIPSQPEYIGAAFSPTWGEHFDAFPVEIVNGLPPATTAAPAWIADTPELVGGIRAMASDSEGGLWAVVGDPVIATWSAPAAIAVGDQVRYEHTLEATATGNDLAYLCDSCTAWVVFDPSAITNLPAGVLLTSLAPVEDPMTPGRGGVDQDNMWLGTTDGLYRLDLVGGNLNVIESHDVDSGLAGSWVTSLERDSVGVLRVGHRGSLYATLHPNASSGQRRWADWGGVSERASNGTWTSYRAEQAGDGNWLGLAGFDVSDVTADEAGGFWAASEQGLSHREAGGAYSFESAATGLPAEVEPRWLAFDNGTLWTAGPGGAARLAGGTWTGFFASPATLPSSDVLDLLIDPEGVVWFATGDAGLVSFDAIIPEWTSHGASGNLLSLRTTPGDWRLISPESPSGPTSVMVFAGDARPELSAPVDLALIKGESPVDPQMTWQAMAGVSVWEVELVSDLAPEPLIFSSTTTTAPVLGLPQGDYWWRVRARFEGATEIAVGPWSAQWFFSVAETRELAPIELVIPTESNLRVEDNTGRVDMLYMRKGRQSSEWWVSNLPADAAGYDYRTADIAGAGDRRKNLAWSQWVCGSISSPPLVCGGELMEAPLTALLAPFEQWPAPELPLDHPFVDRTSDGWVRTTRSVAFNGEAIATGFSLESPRTASAGLTLPLENGATENRIADVAGLAEDRVAILYNYNGPTPGSAVKIYSRPPGLALPIILVSEFEVEGTGVRITGLPDGGLVILSRDSNLIQTLSIYDPSYQVVASHLIGNLEQVSDIDVDEEGRLLGILGPMGGLPIDLAQNGSFEDPVLADGSFQILSSIPGWTLEYGEFELQRQIVVTAADGQQQLELAASSNASIQQTIGTFPGNALLIELAYSARPGVPDSQLVVEWEGVPVGDVQVDGSALVDADWRILTMTVISTTGSSLLTLKETGPNDSFGILIDRVRVLSERRLLVIDGPDYEQIEFLALPQNPRTSGLVERQGFRRMAAFGSVPSSQAAGFAPAGVNEPAGTDFTTLGSTEVWVYHPAVQGATFPDCNSNSGPLWIMGFLRTDNPITCSSTLNPQWIDVDGLSFDYENGGYNGGSSAPPVNWSQGPGVTMLSGLHRIDLITGAITPAGGGSVSVSDPARVLSALGSFTAQSLDLMGLGNQAGSTSLGRGLVVVNGETTRTFGAFGQTITFPNLFLADFTGLYFSTFGGFSGVGPAEGTFGLAGGPAVPLRFRTQGVLGNTGSDVVELGSVVADVLAGSVTLFPFHFTSLSIAPTNISFTTADESFFDGLFQLSITNGCIGDSSCLPGSQLDSGVAIRGNASLTIGEQTLSVTDLAAGSNGFRFAEISGLGFPGLASANLEDVELDIAAESFSAGLLGLSLGSVFDGTIRGLDVPLSTQFSPPAGFPTACRGVAGGDDCADLRVGPVGDELLTMHVGGGLLISDDAIDLPSLELEVLKPYPFTLIAPGARLRSSSLTLFDLPSTQIPLGGVGTLIPGDVITISNRGLAISSVEVRTSGIAATFENFEIITGNPPRLSITGGGFERGGFSFRVSNLDDTDEGLELDAALSFALPRLSIQDVGGRFRISDSSPYFDVLSLTPPASISVGPGVFAIGPPDPVPAGCPGGRICLNLSGSELLFAGTFDLRRLPSVNAELHLNNGDFDFLGLTATFPPPGRPIPAVPGGYLQSLGGSVRVNPFFEVSASLSASVGPSLTIPAVLAGTASDITAKLIALDGTATISSLGFTAYTSLTLFSAPPVYNGAQVATALVALGDLRSLVPWRNPYGSGFYLNAQVNLFEVITGGAELFVYQYGFSGAANGRFGIPDWVDVIGGWDLAYIDLQASGGYSPATFSFDGTAGLNLGCWWTGRTCVMTKCEDCRELDDFCPFGICSWVCAEVDCPGACTDTYTCLTYDVSVSVNDGDFDIDFFRDSMAAAASGRGLRAMTDFRPIEGRVVGSVQRGGAIATTYQFLVDSPAPSASVSVNYSGLAGDVDLEIRFPPAGGGQLFTPLTTIPLQQSSDFLPTPVAGDIPIRYHAVDTVEHREAAYLFRGPFADRQVAVRDFDGPTGEVVTVFEPGPIPLGVYEVTVIANGEVAGVPLPLQLLVGNNDPEFTAWMSEDVAPDPDEYQIGWALIDPDNDPVNVQVSVGASLDLPQNSLPVGIEGGFFTGPDLPAGTIETTELTFTLDQEELHGLQPAHVFISWVDGQFVGTGIAARFTPRGPRHWAHVATVESIADPLAPPQVTGVVAEVHADGSASVLWDPVTWSPPPTVMLTGYEMVAAELGPEGARLLPFTSSVGVGSGTSVTDTFISPGSLEPGRDYRLVVRAIAREQRGITCPCDGTPELGSPCASVEVCDIPTTVSIEHPGPGSLPLDLLVDAAGWTGGNRAPRFLNRPLEVVELGQLYLSTVRLEDLDGDVLNLSLGAHSQLPSGASLPVQAADLSLTQLSATSWLLGFTPVEDNFGRHYVGLDVSDGAGGSDHLDFEVTVGRRGDLSRPGTLSGRVESVPARSVRVGDTFAYQVEVAGLLPGTALAYRVVTGPVGLAVNPSTGLVLWVPTAGDIAVHRVQLAVILAGADDVCATCEPQELASQVFDLEVVDDPLFPFGATLSVQPAMTEVDWPATTVVFDVRALAGSLDWNAQVIDGDWLGFVLSPGGHNDGLITVVVEENDTDWDRTATLLVSAIETSTGLTALRSPVEVTVVQRSSGRPPTVVWTGSTPMPVDQSLDQGDVEVFGSTQLLVQLSEDVWNPPGDSTGSDVSNPASVLLIEVGNDGVANSTVCATPVTGDDTAIAVQGVVYDELSFTATIIFDRSVALEAGSYQLRLCSTDGIVDLAGHALDGDGNGTAGDDFVLDFSVDSSNLLVNPNLDAGLSGWSTNGDGTVVYLPDDADGIGSSGSISFEGVDGIGSPVLNQCVVLAGSGNLVDGGRVRVAGGGLGVNAAIVTFSSPDCSGPPLSSSSVSTQPGDTGGLWLSFSGAGSVPVGATSALLSLNIQHTGSGSYAVGLDSLYFGNLDLFKDGFESSDTSRWSAVTP